MTDRLKGCIVAFTEDVREDDAQALMKAIEQLRGVAGVSRVGVDPGDFVVRTRLKNKLVARLLEIAETL